MAVFEVKIVMFPNYLYSSDIGEDVKIGVSDYLDESYEEFLEILTKEDEEFAKELNDFFNKYDSTYLFNQFAEKLGKIVDYDDRYLKMVEANVDEQKIIFSIPVTFSIENLKEQFEEIKDEYGDDEE